MPLDATSIPAAPVAVKPTISSPSMVLPSAVRSSPEPVESELPLITMIGAWEYPGWLVPSIVVAAETGGSGPDVRLMTNGPVGISKVIVEPAVASAAVIAARSESGPLSFVFFTMMDSSVRSSHSSITGLVARLRSRPRRRRPDLPKRLISVSSASEGACLGRNTAFAAAVPLPRCYPFEEIKLVRPGPPESTPRQPPSRPGHSPMASVSLLARPSRPFRRLAPRSDALTAVPPLRPEGNAEPNRPNSYAIFTSGDQPRCAMRRSHRPSTACSSLRIGPPASPLGLRIG